MNGPSRFVVELALYDPANIKALLEHIGELVARDLIEHLDRGGTPADTLSAEELEALSTFGVDLDRPEN